MTDLEFLLVQSVEVAVVEEPRPCGNAVLLREQSRALCHHGLYKPAPSSLSIYLAQN